MCDLCGRETEKLYLIEIEGSQLKVCQPCSAYGRVLKKIIPSSKTPTLSSSTSENPPAETSSEETVEEIVPNFSKIIRQSREKRGLKQEKFAQLLNIKESLLHQIENGKITPSFNLARRIEKFLQVKLVETVALDNSAFLAQQEKNKQNKSDSLTIGDLINIKKKKKNNS